MKQRRGKKFITKKNTLTSTKSKKKKGKKNSQGILMMT